MKIEFDEEVDRLLRELHARQDWEAHGARGGVSFPAADEKPENSPFINSHLDADALSLYVEQALPPRARAAYTEHLAACDSCRAHLAMFARVTANDAANVTTPEGKTIGESETTNDVGAASDLMRVPVWARLPGAIFASRGLAYALPVLLLLVVGITVFLITAPPQRESIVGRSDNELNANANLANQDAPGIAENAEPQSTTAMTANMNTNAAPTSPPATDAAGRRAQATNTTNGVPAPRVGNMAASDAADTVAMNSNANPASEGRTVTAAPPPPNADRAKAGQAERAETMDSEEMMVTRESANADVANPAPAPPPANANLSTTPRARTNRLPVAGRRARNTGGDPRSGADATAETRRVANRQFTKRGAAWVDDSYTEGAAVTDVRRGSEQFRALVADEPLLRQVVEALAGEVIVVWKNRAYRFR